MGATVDWNDAAAQFGGSPQSVPTNWDTEAAKFGAGTTTPAAAKANPDAALGGTLNVAGFDTGIPLPASIEAGLVGAGKTTNDLLAGLKQAYYGATSNTAAQQKLAQEQTAGNAAYSQLAQAHPVASFVGEAAPLAAGM